MFAGSKHEIRSRAQPLQIAIAGGEIWATRDPASAGAVAYWNYAATRHDSDVQSDIFFLHSKPLQSKDVDSLVLKNDTQSVDAAHIAILHTCLSFAAFLSALFIGSALHYKQIVKNGVAGYPEEWFPSVSATIGDLYPERSIFHILIALNSGPRFILVLLQYHLQGAGSSTLSLLLLCFGVLRTLACGGWVYITSTDDHDWHDLLMISYLVFNIPWMFGGIAATPATHTITRRRSKDIHISWFGRKTFTYSFFLAMLPMVYYFIQHKVHRIPGAYTYYSIFEWSLIILDILYDSVVVRDLQAAHLQVCSPPPFTRASPDYDSRSTLGLCGVVTAKIRICTIDFTAWLDYATQFVPFSSVKGKEKEGGMFEASPLQPSMSSTVAWSQLLPKLPGAASTNLFQPTLNFLCDVYLSYINWSVFTSLTPTLFYFSVWQLGIAGHEFSLFSTLSPLLLSYPIVMNILPMRQGRTVLYGITVAGIAAYASASPLLRLLVVMVANSALCIGLAIDWSGPMVSTSYQGILMGLGFLLCSLSKHANHTNNPIWPIVNEKSGGYNKTGLLLAGLAIWNFYTRSYAEPSLVDKKADDPAPKTTPTSMRKHWFLDSFALGSLIFSLHSILGDSSTLITMSWTGYPIKGPVPHLHGSLTHLAQTIGLLLPIVLPTFAPASNVLSSPLWFAYGCVSTYVMYSFSDWTGYIGGLNLAVFLMSIIPLVLLRAASSAASVAKTYSVAMLVVCLYYVGSVFTVAYAFVPGGEDMELDVLGLLETDLHRPVFGNRDLTRLMAEELGYYVDIGPGPNKHTWGAALLSKYPIIKSTHHLLPSPDGELAPAIHAVLDVYGSEVNVMVVHNGQEETPVDRELQSKEVGRIMGEAYPEPMIFLGYLVTRPHAPRPWPYDFIVTDGKVHDIDKDDLARWCEYIFYRGLYRTSYARVSHGTLTDTELQIGQFVLPKYGFGVTNDTEVGRYLRAWKEELPEIHWLPHAYMPGEGGVNGHEYDKFGTPLYYKFPDGAVL
ncbi:hypothetical protein EUX98_g7963 [Antrodiella citrinella]|uniref:Uncharacterized protein n=1 Tax=Antrodiella citrinella TaxID=2447956 RepID=A0A4S4ME74_9APHY|nr:hypothetical protein EUX98_g7963 [Antrodiella citrinella]